MKPRICICCGEAMVEGKNTLSRNPNVCASCSSLADGMDEAARCALLDNFAAPDSTPTEAPEHGREVWSEADRHAA